MVPENPGIYTIDEVDGRIRIPKGSLPKSLSKATRDGELFLVPIGWKRPVTLSEGHQLEAWYLWDARIQEGEWRIDPKSLVNSSAGVEEEESDYYSRSLIYPAKFDSRSRLACVNLFSALADIAGRKVWVAPEPNSISVWTNFAFQTWYGRLGLN
jgi:hypothetical protein